MFFRRYCSKVILVSVCIALLLLLTGCSNGNKSEHPFDKLYKGQTQESVRTLLGEPDYIGLTRDIDGGNGTELTYTHEGDIDYFNYEFLGEVGILEICYAYDDASKTEKLEYAIFTYDYPDRNDDGTEYVITNLDKDRVREYASNIISYYTKKFGTPEDDFYDYEWYLKDGTMIAMDEAIVYPEYWESCIEIQWDFPNVHH